MLKVSEAVLPIHPINSHQTLFKTFLSYRRVTRGQVMLHLTRNGTDQCQNGSSNFLAPYREQPRSIRIAVAYPRPAFSATKRTNSAPISLDQPGQVSQRHTSCRNKDICSTEAHGRGCLIPVKPARESASSCPKPRASLENAPGILPVRLSLLAIVGRKQTVAREQFFLQKPPGWCLLF